MDYMYPKFFELYPRDLMVKTLDESMNDPILEILLMDSKILEISPLKTADTVTFAKVGYSFVMTLRYVETDENPAPSEEVITMTTNIFKQMYGDENVSFDSQKSMNITYENLRPGFSKDALPEKLEKLKKLQNENQTLIFTVPKFKSFSPIMAKYSDKRL